MSRQTLGLEKSILDYVVPHSTHEPEVLVGTPTNLISVPIGDGVTLTHIFD